MKERDIDWETQSYATTLKAKAILQSLKEKTPCADCKLKYPYYVMDFDHVEGEKRFNLSQPHGRTGRAIAAELRKCEIVCSNCHRERTHSRLLLN